MASPQTAQTQVQFSTSSHSKQLVLEEDKSSGLKPEPNETFVRLTPSGTGAVVSALNSSISPWGARLPETIDEQVLVTGSSASLRYYPSGPVTIVDSGFVGATPAIAYDKETNAITFDAEVSGFLRIRYDVLFDRYKVAHRATACGTGLYLRSTPTASLSTGTTTRYFSTSNLNDTGSEIPNHDTAFIFAKATGWADASLEVTGPPCPPDQSISVYRDSGYALSGLRLEEDAQVPSGIYPMNFSADVEASGFTLLRRYAHINGVSIPLYAGAKVRVYGGIPSVIRGVNCAVSSTTVGAGTKPVLQSLSFSTAYSQNLSYPPEGPVAISGPSTGISTFGEMQTIAFATKGDTVTEVEWTSSSNFTVRTPGRKVRNDEVVIVDYANRTLPCYTFCQAGYTAKFTLIDVLFTWDDTLNWYAPAMVYVEDADGNSGSLEIQPPGRGGAL